MKRFLAVLLLLSAVVYSQTRQVPNLGSSANDGTGDSLRSFGQKVANNESNLFKVMFTNGPVARVFESVSDMVAFDGFAGVQVSTLGYYNPGDGGGAVYRWTNALPSGTTTNSTFWFAGDSGYWSLLHGGKVDVLQTGFVGDGTDSDTALLQSAVDYAPDNTDFVVPDGTFEITKGLLIRRHNVSLSGVGTLKAAEDLDYGTLIDIANATNVVVRDIHLDLDGNYDNGITVIGNTDEFDELDSIVGTNWVQGVVISGVTVNGARFHINLVEGLDVSSTPAFTVGETIRQLSSNGRYLTATVLTNDTMNDQVVVEYDQDRFSIGPEIEGLTSGDVRVVSGRTSIAVAGPDGVDYDSLQGAFGGKGISVQYGTRGVTVSDAHVEDCDVGISIEGNSSAWRYNSGTVILGGVIRNSGRTAIWFSNSGTTVEDMEVFGPTIIGTRIINWGHTFAGFGAISSDRGMYVRISGVTANMESGYTPLGPVTLWSGQAAHSNVDLSAYLPEAANILDFRRHAVWGNLPGFFANGSRNNAFRVRSDIGAVTADVTWSNSLATNTVSYYAVDWEAATADALATSSLYIDVRGWDNDQWLGKSVSNVRYEIVDRSNNSSTAIGSADQVVFDDSYRLTINGLGSEPERVAASFKDRIDVNRKMSVASNRAEFGFDFTNSVPYLKSNGGTNLPNGTFRLRNDSNEDLARLASGRFQVESSTYNGKNFGMGGQVLWFRGTALYTKNGTPSSASDGQPVVPQPTTATLTESGGDVTITGGNRATYSHVLNAATGGDANLVFSSVVDGDTGTLLVWAASTNVALTLTDSFAYSPSGSTLTVTGGTNNWSVVAWEARTINSTNVVLVNLGDYSR